MKCHQFCILLIFLLMLACNSPVADRGNENNAVDEQEGISTSEEDQIELSQMPSDSSNPAESVVQGYVYSRAVLDREMSIGDCGVAPWTPSTCMGPPVHWWGMHLEGVVNLPVIIVPDGENRWVVTNAHEVVDDYGFLSADFDYNRGKYQAASIDPSLTPGCTAELQGKDFSMQVSGERVGDELTLIFSGEPTEAMSGNCNGATFSWENHNLLYGWASAMSHDPMDMTAVMSELNKESKGVYHKTFIFDTNPSPENRDHVEVELQFMCVKQLAESAEPVACPWE